ncbi:hypothetical protein BaRGS_00033985, partial [Batillaria attramentaria]
MATAYQHLIDTSLTDRDACLEDLSPSDLIGNVSPVGIHSKNGCRRHWYTGISENNSSTPPPQYELCVTFVSARLDNFLLEVLKNSTAGRHDMQHLQDNPGEWDMKFT